MQILSQPPTRAAPGEMEGWARRYTEELSWQIYHIDFMTKHNHTPGGHKIASLDTSWWRSHPQDGMAVWLENSGLAVLDIDTRSGGDIERLVHALGDSILNTPMVRSGSVNPGWHLYFQYPSGVKIRHIRHPDLPGTELLIQGAVLPPSVHPSGKRYHWEVGHEPWYLPPLQLPLSVVEMAISQEIPSLRSPTRSHPPLLRLCPAPNDYVIENFQHGFYDVTSYGEAMLGALIAEMRATIYNRNDKLLVVAIRLYRAVVAGMIEESRVIEELSAAAKAAGQGIREDQLSDEEIAHTLMMARGYARGRPLIAKHRPEIELERAA